MVGASDRIVLSQNKRFDDPDYRLLLSAFGQLHPAEFDRLVALEKENFELRRGVVYPDKELMIFVQAFIADRTVDEYGGLGASVASRVLRGHILRALLANEPELNPAPGKILITEPRTHSDTENRWLSREFSEAFPQLWENWRWIEAESDFADDPLRPITAVFHKFLRERCWVQSTTAAIGAFSGMRKLINEDLPDR